MKSKNETSKPAVLIFSGYGLNTENETKSVFEQVGARADIVHLNDVIKSPAMLRRYEIVIFPGGFSYGDDLGGGKAYARKLMHHLKEPLTRFLGRDTLLAGICNGFQIITNAGILPGALISNEIPRYSCRWVDVEVVGDSPWFSGIKKMSIPIAHGEGRYYDVQKNLDALEKNNQVVLRYIKGDVSKHLNLSGNPNGSLRDIAGISAYSGRVIGLMPHPERASRFTQLPHWTYLKEKHEKTPKDGDGLQVFKNAVNYFN